MGFLTFAAQIGLGFALMLGMHLPTKESSSEPDYAAKLSCKTGYVAGKTPVKLGGKKACVKKADATAGKKLLTGMTNTCYACHSAMGIAPYKQMTANLRAQNLTLKAADITVAFNAHVAEMAGATLTSKQAKQISAFLQSIK